MKGSDVSTYFSTFIEFKLSQTAMPGNVISVTVTSPKLR